MMKIRWTAAETKTLRAACFAAAAGVAITVGFLIVGEAFQIKLLASPSALRELYRLNHELIRTALVLDGFFLISYTLVFLGLFAVARREAPLLAAVALGFALLTTLGDIAENGFQLLTAWDQSVGIAPTWEAVQHAWYAAWVTDLADALALVLFASALPRRGRLEWAITVLLLALAACGLLQYQWSACATLRFLLFILGMIVIAVYFRQQLKKRPAA